MGFKKCAATIGVAVCLSWLLLAGDVAMAREKGPRDRDEALQWAQEALVKSGYRVNKVDSQYLLYGDDKGNYGIALARVVSTSAEFSGGYTWRVFWQDYAHDQREAMVIAPRQMEKLKMALEYLSAAARQEETENQAREFAQFQVQAKVWREVPLKPTMPEGAREHQVLAEFAFKEKNADKAISEYSAALSVFPTWPEGQYNLATLAGEKKMYDVAIHHMKYYLELAPDSPDAQAAKDSVIIWKDKLQTALSTVAAAPEPGKQQHRGAMFQQVKSK
jgi:tetratricopeptide (TPR) repeat protein